MNVNPSTDKYLSKRKGYFREKVINILNGIEKLPIIDVQEHTAQLSYKDTEEIHSTIEDFELKFQDVLTPFLLPYCSTQKTKQFPQI